MFFDKTGYYNAISNRLNDIGQTTHIFKDKTGRLVDDGQIKLRLFGINIKDIKGKFTPIQQKLVDDIRKVAKKRVGYKNPSDDSNAQQAKTSFLNSAGIITMDATSLASALESGTDVNSTDSQGKSFLFYATHANKIELMQVLLKHNAIVDILDDKGATPLILASYRGHLEAVRLLLDAGADPTIASKNGNTALSVVCSITNISDEKKANKVAIEQLLRSKVAAKANEEIIEHKSDDDTAAAGINLSDVNIDIDIDTPYKDNPNAKEGDTRVPFLRKGAKRNVLEPAVPVVNKEEDERNREQKRKNANLIAQDVETERLAAEQHDLHVGQDQDARIRMEAVAADADDQQPLLDEGNATEWEKHQ